MVNLDILGDSGIPKSKRGKSLTDQAYAILRHSIITGKIAPGTEVSELEIAQQLAMSKTPVREALARLGVEGLVEAFPRRGYRITSLTVKDMNDLFAVRAMLEGTAGAMAARNLAEEDLNVLESLADANYEVGENMSVQSFIKANEDFHSAIARGTDNPRLYSLVMRHLEECARFFYMGANVRDVNPETSADHHRIVAVLRKRDPEKARSAMVEHSENTRRGLLASLISQGQAGLTL